MRAALGRWDDRPRGGHWPDEPPHGLMMRLAARHRNPSAARFAEGFGIEIDDVPACMDVLASYEHADEYPEQIECLRQWVPAMLDDQTSGTRWRRVAGQEVRYFDWSVGSRRFCPGCLHEAPYHRAWFDLTFIRTCPDHGLAIVDRTEDGALVGFATASVDVTSVGAQLSRPAPRVRTRRRSIEAYAMARLGLREGSPSPLLDPMRLGEVVALCEAMGAAVLGGHREHMPTDDELGRTMGEIVDTGFAVLDEGRDAIVSAFKDVGRAAPERTYGARRLFGWLYPWFAILPGTHAVRDLLMDAARELGRAGTRHAGEWEGEAEHVTLAHIAEKHNLNRKSVRTVAEALGVIHSGGGKGFPLIVASHHVRVVQVGFEWARKRYEAARQLGITDDTMDWLVRSGHLTWSWRGLDGDNAERYHLGALIGFVEGLPFQYVDPDDPVLEGHPRPVPLPAVLDKAHRVDLDVLVEAYEGRVTLLASTTVPVHLSDFLVSPDEPSLLRLGLATSRPRLSHAPVAAMTKREACTVLNVLDGTIGALVEAGHLSMIDGKLGESRSAIDRASVERFAERYLAGRFYAEAVGMRLNDLTSKAEKAGVFDLIRDARMRDAFYNTSAIYERSAMTELLGLPRDPDKDRPGHLAWMRFATFLGHGRSGFMVWKVQGERLAVCAMNKFLWQVAISIGQAAVTGACTVRVDLSLTKRDKVDVNALAAVVAAKPRPPGLTFDLDEARGRIDASLLVVIPGWGGDAGIEADEREDEAFRTMERMLVHLRGFFEVGSVESTSAKGNRKMRSATIGS